MINSQELHKLASCRQIFKVLRTQGHEMKTRTVLQYDYKIRIRDT